MKRGRIGRLLLLSSAFPVVGAAQEPIVDTLRQPCARVTVVTYPWAVLRPVGQPRVYTPTTIELCAGEHQLVLEWEGRGSDTSRVEIQDTTYQGRFVRLSENGRAVPLPEVIAADAVVAEAVRAYLEQGDAYRARELLEPRLGAGDLEYHERLTALLYLAYAGFALGDTSQARRSVRELMDLEPCLTPTNDLANPRVRLVFERDRPMVCDFRTTHLVAASALLPGAANALTLDRLDGLKHFVLVLAPAIGAAVLLSQAANEYDNYLATDDPLLAEVSYDRATLRRRAGIGLATVAGVLYFRNLYDAWRVGRRHTLQVTPYLQFSGGLSHPSLRAGGEVPF